jgi:glutaredoxin 3
MSLTVEIFGKDNCPFCDKAKALAERQGHEYTYKRLGEHFEMGFIATEFPDARTFPQIKVNGNYCGGYTEYETLVGKL